MAQYSDLFGMYRAQPTRTNTHDGWLIGVQRHFQYKGYIVPWRYEIYCRAEDKTNRVEQ